MINSGTFHQGYYTGNGNASVDVGMQQNYMNQYGQNPNFMMAQNMMRQGQGMQNGYRPPNMNGYQNNGTNGTNNGQNRG